MPLPRLVWASRRQFAVLDRPALSDQAPDRRLADAGDLRTEDASARRYARKTAQKRRLRWIMPTGKRCTGTLRYSAVSGTGF